MLYIKNMVFLDGAISRLPVWAPSPMPDVLFRETPKEMEPEDIEEVARYFAKSAIHAREGGFDGIELQFGHSSLSRQFLSPLTNFRTDEYGGSLENRMRAPLKFIGAVRKGTAMRNAAEGESIAAGMSSSVSG